MAEQQEIPQQPIEQKEQSKEEQPEDQFGLTDILKILEQPQKVSEISNNQKEIESILKDEIQHISKIQKIIETKSKDFNKTIDQGIALLKDTKNDLLVIQAKLQNMKLMLKIPANK